MSETVEVVNQDMAHEVEDDGADDAGLGAPSLAAGLEALLLLADEPMSALTLAAITRQPLADVQRVAVLHANGVLAACGAACPRRPAGQAHAGEFGDSGSDRLPAANRSWPGQRSAWS